MRCRVDVSCLLLLGSIGACGDGGGFPDAPEPPPIVDPGTFAIDWSITTPGGQLVTCGEANATTVRVGIVDETSGARASGSFDCLLGGGVSGALLSSTYDLNFFLLGASGTVATASPQTGVAITAGHTIELAKVAFIVPSSLGSR
jgi:hypothetical protein